MSVGFTIDNNNVFNSIFTPVAKKIAIELLNDGVHVFFADQDIPQEKFPRIVFGAVHNPDFWIENKKGEDIFVNFEPIFDTNWQIDNFSYIKLLNSSKVLDYNKKSKNVIKQAEFLPLPSLYNSDKKNSKNTDVLFVGSINERRKLIFKNLTNDDINLTVRYKIFGEELFQLIDDAKIFLDIKFSDNYLFNIYRFCLCANTNTIYVGEAGDISDYPEIEELLGLTIINSQNELSKTVIELLRNKNHLENLLNIQKNIATKLDKKFKNFMNKFSKNFIR